VFAVIYFCLPAHSFYHQTSQFEQGVTEDQHKAEEAIEKSMLAEIGTRVSSHGWTFNAIQVRNLAPVPSSGDFKFLARLNLERAYGSVPAKMGATRSVAAPSVEVTVQNDTSSATSMLTPDGRHEYVVIASVFEAPQVTANDLFPFNDVTKRTSLWIPVADDVKLKIDAYLDDVHGFPHEYSWDHFGRMLYFSASTVTTAGFGDILPLTGLARFFTTAEAILGIVAIGLFLNSLAGEASRPSGK